MRGEQLETLKRMKYPTLKSTLGAGKANRNIDSTTLILVFSFIKGQICIPFIQSKNETKTDVI